MTVNNDFQSPAELDEAEIRRTIDQVVEGLRAKVFLFFESVTYEVRDLTFTVGGDVAFGHAFARLSGTLKNGAATSGMWVRVTYGMRKIDNTWLIAHDQVSVPFDISSGKGVIDLEP